MGFLRKLHGIPSALIIVFFGNTYCSNSVTNIQNQNNIKLIYYENTSGQDVYNEGDALGVKFIIYSSGNVEEYLTYYKSEDKLLKTSFVFRNKLIELDNLFTQYDFNNYPDILPSTNNIHWPNRSCFISYSQNERNTIKEVTVIAFEDAKYYPKGFYDFIDKLKEKLNSLIK